MDILGHALWTTAAADCSRRRLGRQVHLGWAAFWGIFPTFSALLFQRWYESGGAPREPLTR